MSETVPQWANDLRAACKMMFQHIEQGDVSYFEDTDSVPSAIDQVEAALKLADASEAKNP